VDVRLCGVGVTGERDPGQAIGVVVVERSDVIGRRPVVDRAWAQLPLEVPDRVVFVLRRDDLGRRELLVDLRQLVPAIVRVVGRRAGLVEGPCEVVVRVELEAGRVPQRIDGPLRKTVRVVLVSPRVRSALRVGRARDRGDVGLRSRDRPKVAGDVVAVVRAERLGLARIGPEARLLDNAIESVVVEQQRVVVGVRSALHAERRRGLLQASGDVVVVGGALFAD
jgi:hypothetical protein